MCVSCCFMKPLDFALNCILKILRVNIVFDWPVESRACLIMNRSDTMTTGITGIIRLCTNKIALCFIYFIKTTH